MTTASNTEIVDTPHELEVLATKILDGIQMAHAKSEDALISGMTVGCLLQQAEAECKSSGASYHQWTQERLNLNRETVKKWSSLYVNWPQIAEALQEQTCFDFGAAKRLLDKKQPKKAIVDGAVFEKFDEFPDSAFEVPETVSDQFSYPEESNDQESGEHTVAEAFRAVLKFISPAEVQTVPQWKTMQLRMFGVMFALNAMPEGCSMRQCCNALELSHGALSKFVRKFSDDTGCRSPNQKKESTRATYSKAQKENHWRNKKNASGVELGEDGLPK